MSRTPDESYGVTARPLAPIIDGRFTDGANWYFFSQTNLLEALRLALNIIMLIVKKLKEMFTLNSY